MAEWNEAMNNLMKRREAGTLCNQPIIDNYRDHIEKAIAHKWVQKNDHILDIGCGDLKIRSLLSEAHLQCFYKGFDPFPITDEVEKGIIEENQYANHSFDTVFCFAVLDGTQDLQKALSEINRVTSRSIILLTGIGIEPDYCHTFKIELDVLDKGFSLFHRDYTEWLHPKVALIHYKIKE